jgi:ABC-type uncharacterized transport system substrate-binding protein
MLYYNTIQALARKILRASLSFFVAVCGFIVLQTPPAQAHPHAWIDVQSEIVFNAAGHITGLRETWLFDEFYTEFALQDFGAGKGGKIHPDKLLELGKDNLNNLKNYSYFTYMDADKIRLTFSGYKDLTSELKGNRISLSFTLLLKNPVNPYKHKVSYRIYDPSYYIEMKHLNDDGVKFSGQNACRTSIERPKPDVAFISMAAALDKNAKAPDDLGAFFAERVHVHCP